MNIVGLAILAYVLLGIELALRQVLALGESRVSLMFLLPLALYVALHAPAGLALWAGLVLGACVDLLTQLPMPGGGTGGGGGVVLILGPNALGYTAAVYLTLTVRSLLNRRNPLVLSVMTLLGGTLSALVVVALITAKNVISHTLVWSGSEQVMSRSASALYSMLSAFALAYVLRVVGPYLGLGETQQRRFGR